MSHPDPHGPPDLTPIQIGEVWENPINRERLTILELPWPEPRGPRGRRADRARWGARCWRAPPCCDGRALHRARGRADGETGRADEHPARGRDGHRRGGRVARLVESPEPPSEP